jgi:acetolactate synthase-1/2/3 large subunit
MKLSDYVMQFLVERQVDRVFVVPGGAAMHLDDSLAGAQSLEFVATLHEQAAAIAAEGHAKTTGRIGVALVTAGPGGTNAVTGVAGAWLDSSPVLFLSGQVKRSDLAASRGVRSFGVQEVDIVSIVRPITKYAALVTEPSRIRFELEKAHHLATTGRPGPVWLDLPLDVQGAEIETDGLEAFVPAEAELGADAGDVTERVRRTLEILRGAERPALLVGNGVRCAHGEAAMLRAVELLGVPVLLTWHSIDLLPASHPFYAGRPGLVAPRGANFTLQNADALLVIGARLDLVISGYAPERLARAARKIVVDVDRAELEKSPAELHVHCDARVFLEELVRQLEHEPRREASEWLARVAGWKRRYPVVLPEHRASAMISTFAFTEALDAELDDELVVSGCAGAAIEIFLLAHEVKPQQRLIHTTGLGAMGYGLPLAVGACLGAGRRRTVVVKGDGGLQFNVQELETIRRLGLPIKIFVLSNEGYSSIRMSQRRHFGRLLAADATSGLTLPEVRKIAAAYGIGFHRMADPRRLHEDLRAVLDTEGPQLCEVLVLPDEERAPCLVARQLPNGSMWSPPLEDLSPPLDRDELRANMSIPLLEHG